MILGNSKFLGVPPDSINLEGIKRFMADDENAKRIHFATTHSYALRKETAGTPFGWFNIPFDKTVGPMLKKELGSGFKLFLNNTYFFYSLAVDLPCSSFAFSFVSVDSVPY